MDETPRAMTDQWEPWPQAVIEAIPEIGPETELIDLPRLGLWPRAEEVGITQLADIMDFTEERFVEYGKKERLGRKHVRDAVLLIREAPGTWFAPEVS